MLVDSSSTSSSSCCNADEVRKEEDNVEKQMMKIKIDLKQKSTIGHVLSSIDAQTAHDFEFFSSKAKTTRIIFVEKEAVAKQLLSSSSSKSLLGQGNSNTSNNLIFTKGYPCHSSRMFLKRLISEFSSSAETKNSNNDDRILEICFINDCDPHGVQIILTICGLTTTSKNSQQQQQLQNKMNNDKNIFEFISSSKNNIKFRWIALKPSLSLMSSSSSSASTNLNTNFHHRLVPWTLSDTQCTKSVLTSLEKHLLCTTTHHQQEQESSNNNISIMKRNFLMMLYEEMKIMNQKKMKLELEALREDLVKIIEEEVEKKE